MAIPSPNLDDRSFEQLIAEARAIVTRSASGWTDLSPGDPGTVLLEVFAYLTSLLIYRTNRLPEKIYVELLRLIGLKMAPPAAACVQLRFSLAKEQAEAVEIPAGTRVTVARAGGADTPVFMTTAPATIAPGALVVEPVPACHTQRIEAERVGAGSGRPRQSFVVARPPIIATTDAATELLVGVEELPSERDERAAALYHEGKAFRLWKEVENFTGQATDSFTFVADRASGRIDFAPAVRAVDPQGRLEETPQALAHVPDSGREIRVWYSRGGGESGNVAPDTLTVLRDPIRGVNVTNPEPATGGAAAESLENAMLRGPQEMHSLRRAVTARDFEGVALHSSGAIARTKALPRAEMWRHATPGTVEVLLVPRLGTLEQRGGGVVTREALKALETDDALERVHAALDTRRPLGIACVVNWVSYKTVRVCARVVVHGGEDIEAVRQRVLERLHLTVNPLPTPLQPDGWPFGEPLRSSNVFDIVLREPGVSFVDQVRFTVDDVPGADVKALAVDPSQPHTWHAGAGTQLFRSLNDGDSWESVIRFENEIIEAIATNANVPGLLAACTQLADGHGRVHVSRDCGESWSQATELAFAINDVAWLQRASVNILLMATDTGLYELAMTTGASPLQLAVGDLDANAGFYAVTSFIDGRNGTNVAAAAQQSRGIFLSRQAGSTRTFARIHPGSEDIRTLAAQRLGASTFLWAGITVGGTDKGKGCLRWELPSAPDSVESVEGWRAIGDKWLGGSCRALAFDGLAVYAGTHSAGVSLLDSAHPEAGWQASSIQCGLPTRDVQNLFKPVDTLAVSGDGALVMSGGPPGVYASTDRAVTWASISSSEFSSKVALPRHWLFCSGNHDIRVVTTDEAQ